MRVIALQIMLAATALSLIIGGPSLGQGAGRGSGSGSAGAGQTAPGLSAPDVRGPASGEAVGPAGPTGQSAQTESGDREGASERVPDASNVAGPLGWLLTLLAGIAIALVILFVVRGPWPGRRRGPTT